MRLFIAVNFDNDTRSRLLALRDELCEHSQRGNFSAPENLHLTLAFLGECDAKKTAAAMAVLDMLSFEPFVIAIERVGRFKRAGGDIWWAGVRENNILSRLHSELSARLRESGFALESRGFNPHITLGREIITDYAFGQVEPFGETVKCIELMKSERVGGRLTYTAIKRSDAKNAY